MLSADAEGFLSLAASIQRKFIFFFPRKLNNLSREYTATETPCVLTLYSKSCKIRTKLARTLLTESFAGCSVSHGDVLVLTELLGRKVSLEVG